MRFSKYTRSAVIVTSILLVTGCSIRQESIPKEDNLLNEISIDAGNTNSVVPNKNIDVNMYASSMLVSVFTNLSEQVVGLTNEEFLNKLNLYDNSKVLDVKESGYDYLPDYCRKYTITEDGVKDIELIVEATKTTEDQGEDQVDKIDSISLILYKEHLIVKYTDGSYSVELQSINPLVIERPEHSLGGKYSKLQEAVNKNEYIPLSEIEVILNHKFTDDEKVVTSIDGPGISIEDATCVEFVNDEGMIELVFDKGKLCEMSYTEDVNYLYEVSGYALQENHTIQGNQFSVIKNDIPSLVDVSEYIGLLIKKNK